MESSSTTNQYLHKKFKKQLSIDPRPHISHNQQQHNQINNNIITTTEKHQKENNDCSSTTTGNSIFSKSSISVQIRDVVVTTDRQTDVTHNDNNNTKITTEILVNPITIQKSPIINTTCISYVATNHHITKEEDHHYDHHHQNEHQLSSNFDMKFSEEPTNYSTTTNINNSASSILDESYPINNIIIKQQHSEINHYHQNHQFHPSSYTTLTTTSSYNVPDYLQKLPIEEQPLPLESSKSLVLDDIHQLPSSTSTVPSVDKNSSNGKYICPYCNLVCSKPSVLQKHIRAHTNERPYPCKSCGFSFKTRSNLYKHCRSRTHANRVMGIKTSTSGTQDANPLTPSNLEYNNNPDNSDDKEDWSNSTMILATTTAMTTTSSQSSKPYKPRFHTVKEPHLPDNMMVAKENMEGPNAALHRHPASDMLSQHINEIINKNNCIVNDSITLKRRIMVNSIDDMSDASSNNNQNEYYNSTAFTEPRGHANTNFLDEPLNLTNKNRKRSLSEVTEPVIQKSLIKELLLKNLSASDMQCPHCKMIFQTVTELDVHKYRNCRGKPAGTKYTRSSSVNVASILTQNKNAFDNIPHMQNFSLNSPGPFLGKTRLVDSDKNKSFSFDNCKMSPTNITTAVTSPSLPNYLLSPSLPFDKDKKGLKLFGGEVKIHSLSDESKTSFKMDVKDEQFTTDPTTSSYMGYGENRVIKSSLHSGGTVLTNKTNYNNKQDIKVTQEVIRVYDNHSLVSPNIDMSNFGAKKTQFPFDNSTITDEPTDVYVRANFIGSNESSSQKHFNTSEPNITYKYTNIMDFSQKAIQKITPNLKQPIFNSSNNLLKKITTTTAELNINNNIHGKTNNADIESVSSATPSVQSINAVTTVNNVDFESKKQYKKQHSTQFSTKTTLTTATTSNNLYNPMKLFVNGRVVRHVPGMPGPVLADNSVDVNAAASAPAAIIAIGRNEPLNMDKTPTATAITPKCVGASTIFLLSERSSSNELRNDQSNLLLPPPPARITEPKTPDTTTPVTGTLKLEIETRKFARPNSLALKPSTASLKQHHGLTPTKFNQILISPDTPRVAKKYAELYLHGNYFSYLGLKSSTKPVYCTLNKTQPFYVHNFKKLSMYSEWRQQDTRQDKFYVSNYDSRQRNGRYSVAGRTTASLIIHSSYKFMVSELPSSKSSTDKEATDQLNKNNNAALLLGGYECNDDYTYIRGRGRGRYVCDQCGIRCKKPSMLKKHIRTHSNDRPYTCSPCNFSFKTKGNLTKHMKSKAHTKNYTTAGSGGGGGSSGSSSTQQSAPSCSDSDTDDSGMDSSDESITTRQQEHEAAYGLLSLSSQKPTMSSAAPSTSQHLLRTCSSPSNNDLMIDMISSEEIAYVSKTNYAKNKILDDIAVKSNFNTRKLTEVATSTTTSSDATMTTEARNNNSNNVASYLGKIGFSTSSRPLTYPYTSVLSMQDKQETFLPTTRPSPPAAIETFRKSPNNLDSTVPEPPKSIKQFHVIQKYLPQEQLRPPPLPLLHPKKVPAEAVAVLSSPKKTDSSPFQINAEKKSTVPPSPKHISPPNRILPTLKLNDIVISSSENTCVDSLRKRKLSLSTLDNSLQQHVYNKSKKMLQQRLNHDEVIDLSMQQQDKVLDSNRMNSNEEDRVNLPNVEQPLNNEVYSSLLLKRCNSSPPPAQRYHNYNNDEDDEHSSYKSNDSISNNNNNNGTVIILRPLTLSSSINEDQQPQQNYIDNTSSDENNRQLQPYSHRNNENQQQRVTTTASIDYDNSAMETLADIATKQVKLEKNMLAKSVATEFLKLATKNDNSSLLLDGCCRGDLIAAPCTMGGGVFPASSTQEVGLGGVGDIIVKSEGNKSCTICAKSFNKPSQLRLHMNIHYIERPFRCDSCSVSFRTKGHLQKHERSAGHHNKLSSSPALSTTEPRPFKCTDCNIAFRIHGHLAKHLRSKMHIMKLECLAKIPFGLYAELERSNSLLTEINTCDGDQCLESLKILAKKVFINDPSKLNNVELTENLSADC